MEEKLRGSICTYEEGGFTESDSWKGGRGRRQQGVRFTTGDEREGEGYRSQKLCTGHPKKDFLLLSFKP